MSERTFKQVQQKDGLVLQQANIPTKLEEHEVLLRMKAAPIHPSDLIRVRGQYGPYEGPAGGEGVGVVQEVGSGVADLKVGQRVAFYTAGQQQGTWAEYFVLDTKKCPLYIVVPDQLSDEDASQLVLNPLTVIGLLRTLNIQKGEWVLQTAAASALGKQLIQYAKIKGYRTINVVRRESQIAELKALGADEVVLLDDHLQENVKRIEPNLKHAVDAISGKVAGQILSTLTEGGVLLVYGLLSSPEITVSVFSLVRTGASVKGYLMGHWVNEPAEARKVLEDYTQLLISGKLHHTAKAFKLEEFAQAIQYQETPGHTDKSILLL